MNWTAAIGLDAGTMLAEMAGGAVRARACPACGHQQAQPGSCGVCGQRLTEPVPAEVANAINAQVALGENAAMPVPDRSLIGAMREGALDRARAVKARGRQWNDVLGESDRGGHVVDFDAILMELAA